MEMNVMILGSTGMVGHGLLLECLEDKRVKKVLLYNRSKLELEHPKVVQIIDPSFQNLADYQEQLKEIDSCFFCMGTTAVGKTEKEYTDLTYDLTMYVAKQFHQANENGNFFYISGAGTDSTEKGKQMWARVKGRTENALFNMGFRRAYAFRPGYIQPLKGIKSKTLWYNRMYQLMSPLYFVLKLFPKYITDSVTLSKAMINACFMDEKTAVFESADVNRFGK